VCKQKGAKLRCPTLKKNRRTQQAVASVLVYEYTCCVGEGSDPVLRNKLSAEGRAMMIALATDLIAASQHTLIMWNDRLGDFPLVGANVVSTGPATDERLLFARYARQVDWTIIIAPETGGLLAERCRWIESAGARLLGCASTLVELLADKHRTVEHLAAKGVLTPRGETWRFGEPAPALPCPVVVKPNDGAGSERTFLVEDRYDFHRLLANYEGPARIEEYASGVPCSVSFFCGPRGCCPLQPCYQRIQFDRAVHYEFENDPGKFKYVGGRLPMRADLSTRAIRLASRAVQTLPSPFGYLGVDLVLGDCGDGSRDFVIEVNPRLTTSYVGLRAAARSNLAQAMLAAAAGQQPALSFDAKPVEFDPDGAVRSGDQILNPEP
jgi:predicted ATP-grasp superfamily ATP-dependent carboligase